MRVGVVYGGTPEERGPSKKNAGDIAQALKSRGYDVYLTEIGRDIIRNLKDEDVDVVFLCVQGKGYGDGTFQAMLEHEGIPFTGSGMRAASLINDKILCKLLFDHYKISTPKWDILDSDTYRDGSYPYEEFGYPFVAKSPTQGGSFGIELIRGREDLAKIRNVFAFDDPIFIESFIDGGFYTAGLYEKDDDLVVLPPVEGVDLDRSDESSDIISFTGNYDIRECTLSKEMKDRLTELAASVYKVTGARGYARVDIMVSKDMTPYVLEINAVPGLKRASLMPKEAERAGIVYEDMIEDILTSAFSQITFA
ncbi:MAG: ATP-grasp domain-containing protein [Lachnospiraceae bacterium]|nr:ATP-grasp domain-containing protein [Lachnospiraceae bacterium]